MSVRAPFAWERGSTGLAPGIDQAGQPRPVFCRIDRLPACGPTENSPLAGFRLQATEESFRAGPKKLKRISPGEIAIVSGGIGRRECPQKIRSEKTGRNTRDRPALPAAASRAFPPAPRLASELQLLIGLPCPPRMDGSGSLACWTDGGQALMHRRAAVSAWSLGPRMRRLTT